MGSFLFLTDGVGSSLMTSKSPTLLTAILKKHEKSRVTSLSHSSPGMRKWWMSELLPFRFRLPFHFRLRVRFRFQNGVFFICSHPVASLLPIWERLTASSLLVVKVNSIINSTGCSLVTMFY